MASGRKLEFQFNKDVWASAITSRGVYETHAIIAHDVDHHATHSTLINAQEAIAVPSWLPHPTPGETEMESLQISPAHPIKRRGEIANRCETPRWLLENSPGQGKDFDGWSVPIRVLYNVYWYGGVKIQFRQMDWSKRTTVRRDRSVSPMARADGPITEDDGYEETEFRGGVVTMKQITTIDPLVAMDEEADREEAITMDYSSDNIRGRRKRRREEAWEG